MQLDWVTFALEIVNFLVLVWILQHFLYKPILATIARRRAAIAKDLADASDRRKEADELETKYRERLAEWEKEKEGLRAEALARIEDERKRRLAALQAELDREKEKRQAIEQRQAEENRRKVEQEAMAQAGRMASALLQRLASPAVEDRLVAVMVEDLGQLDDVRRRSLVDACGRTDGKVRVQSAYELPDPARDAVIAALSKAAGRAISAEFDRDASLVAGLRVDVGSLVLHANVGDELQFFAVGTAHAG
jgi:F-type H+-transporting ATPase subunit b